MLFNNPIYPITDTSLSGISHAEQVKRMASTGVDVIQLREKSMTSRDFYNDAKEALDIAKSNSIKLLINDRVDIALAIGADGVHLGQDDLSSIEARKLLGDKAIIGYSTHTLEQAVEALEYPLDYIAIGPVFPTSTKTAADPVVEVDEVKRIRAEVGDIELVAIGGITVSNIGELSKTGVDSAAVISALFVSGNSIEESVNSLKAQW